MDKHNFYVFLMYAVIVCVVLSLCGQTGLGVLALIGYTMYGLIVYAEGRRKQKRLEKCMENVSEQVREITICHIRARNPRLKKSEEEQVLKDISEGNYQIYSRLLTEKDREDFNDGDSGYDYYLTFDNKNTYWVSESVYDRVAVGDCLWVVKTSASVMQVLQSGPHGYFNMFGHPVVRTKRTETPEETDPISE